MKQKPRQAVAAYLHQMSVEQLHSLIRLEIKAMREEGYHVAEFLEELDLRNTKASLVALYHELLGAPRAREFGFCEPDTLAEIQQSRPDGPRKQPYYLEPDKLYDRIYGGWLGRTAGCVLGKPVEPWGRWDVIADYLKIAGGYPLADYFPRLDPFPSRFYLNPSAAGTFRGEIHGAPPDDDTDYTILGLHLLETYGLALTTPQVADVWLDRLAFSRTYTAERAAYRNLILGISALQAADVLNPEREYIGARIRADIYGLVCPAMPELAAELAFRDAVLSHRRNGVYSAMFMAACIAWSFVTDSIVEIIQVGLSEIPSNCRLAADILQVVDLHSRSDSWEAVFKQLLPTQALYHPVHAINNSVWMVLALLYGGGDFEKSICIAVMCGFDSDCNGANAGALVGSMIGARGLPAKWTAPLEDTLYTSIADWRDTRISTLSLRTAKIAQHFTSGENNVIPTHQHSQP